MARVTYKTTKTFAIIIRVLSRRNLGENIKFKKIFIFILNFHVIFGEAKKEMIV